MAVGLKGQISERVAFTLVELLVVIGIIGLLISILLPALNSARRQAATVQCSSNLRQVAMGMLQYINTAKGKFPPCAITASATNGFPNGWWWATELVRQKFVSAPNAYPNGVGPNLALPSAFKCPVGNDTSGGAGTYPTDGPNFGWSVFGNATAEQFGIPSWYMLPAANLSNGSRLYKGGSAAAFVYFQNGTNADFIDPERQRWMGLVKRSQELVMICEASTQNFTDAPAGSIGKTPRLAARHGKKTPDGYDAFTNIAFFDGHVATFATQPFSQNGFGAKRDVIWTMQALR